jgi:hypothetical protein
MANKTNPHSEWLNPCPISSGKPRRRTFEDAPTEIRPEENVEKTKIQIAGKTKTQTHWVDEAINVEAITLGC